MAMLDEPRLLAANPWVTRRPITVVEYHRMGEVGILGKRDGQFIARNTAAVIAVIEKADIASDHGAFECIRIQELRVIAGQLMTKHFTPG